MKLPHNRSKTSIAAARAARKSALSQSNRVLLWFAGRGNKGGTRSELQQALGISGDAARPRVLELIEHGCLIETEETRRTPSGRAAFVVKFRDFKKK